MLFASVSGDVYSLWPARSIAKYSRGCYFEKSEPFRIRRGGSFFFICLVFYPIRFLPSITFSTIYRKPSRTGTIFGARFCRRLSAIVGLLTDFCPTFVRLFVGLLSDYCPTFVRLFLVFFPSAVYNEGVKVPAEISLDTRFQPRKRGGRARSVVA